MKIKASFDDASAEDLKVAELMSKYDIETIFYFPVYPSMAFKGTGRKALTDNEMQLIASEFEIGSHTITHPLLTRIPDKKAAYEIANSRTILADKFNQEINSFSYPRGYANPQLEQHVAEAGYLNARGVTVGYIYQSENTFYEQTTVHVGCDRQEYGGKNWFDYALYMLEQAQNTANSVFHFWGHGWELEKSGSWLKFEELLKAL